MNPFLPTDSPFLDASDWTFPAYREQFVHWDDESWVRSKPFREYDLTGSYSFFSRDLVPYFAHPALAGVDAGSEQLLLASHLARWCSFTLWVEDGLVVRAAADLARDASLPVSSEARLEADFLRIDEAAHSAFTGRLELAVLDAAGIEPSRLPHATALAFRSSLAVVGPSLEPLTRVAWSIATETLISGELGRSARDPSVFPAITGVILDHAKDEAGTHAPYFVQVLRALWPNLTSEGRRFLVGEIALALRAYLQVDERWLAGTLEVLGITREPAAVARDICTSERVEAAVRAGANSTLRLLKGLGAFADPELAGHVRERGLVA